MTDTPTHTANAGQEGEAALRHAASSRFRATANVLPGRVPQNPGIEVGEHSDLSQCTVVDLFDTVVRVLQQALLAEPSRNDLRNKLLEVLFHSTNVAEFERHAADFDKHRAGGEGSAWEKICEMGRALNPTNSLFTKPGSRNAEAGDDTPRTYSPMSNRRYYDGFDTHQYSRATEHLSRSYGLLSSGPELFDRYAGILRELKLRPTPLQWLERVNSLFGATSLLFKREDLRTVAEAESVCAIGQVLVAAQLGKRKVVTSSSSGATGLAVAKAASLLKLHCTVYIPSGHAVSDDTQRYMRSCGAEIVQDSESFLTGVCGYRNAAITAWLSEHESTMYVCGRNGGPTAQQKMLLDMQSIIGRECLQECISMGVRDLSAVYASTSAGLASLGLITPFMGSEIRRVVAHTGKLDNVPYRREHHWLLEARQVEYHTIDTDTALEAQMAIRRVEKVDISIDDARALSLALLHARHTTRPTTVILLLSPQSPAAPGRREERTERLTRLAALEVS